MVLMLQVDAGFSGGGAKVRLSPTASLFGNIATASALARMICPTRRLVLEAEARVDSEGDALVSA